MRSERSTQTTHFKDIKSEGNEPYGSFKFSSTDEDQIQVHTCRNIQTSFPF